jgi:hypothetical protein
MVALSNEVSSGKKIEVGSDWLGAQAMRLA